MARHGSLAEQLIGVRLFATTPDHEPEPVQTNWSVVPANDNNPEDVEGMAAERRWRMKPSVEEIMRAVDSGEIERNGDGQVVRIGRIRFSDGSQTEQGFKLTIDGKVVAAQIRMPAGAMLGTKDAAENQLGAEEDSQAAAASNRYFADLLKTLPHRYRSGGKRRRGRNYSRDEAAAMLAEAYANTNMAMVTFTRYPDGLPCGSPKMAQVFPGMVKTCTGESGSMAWQDIVIAKADRDVWAATVDSLSHSDRQVLDAAATAGNMKDIGTSMGFAGKTAERRGKRSLIAANDNLMRAIEAYAA
ncbi:hypothetical protein J5277_09515 [Rhizobium sp. 16-449-1b]|nr:hypothetical protein [Rhizobium sp. 16-449-1b]MBO9194342.1 hypothetical protein [Rhizobium sp. 16-449-1b]